MLRLEAFTQGKNRKFPDKNEDSFVLMPGLGYAVIDGVTDRNGSSYDGMLSGRFASQITKRAIETFLLAQTDPAQSQLRFDAIGAIGMVRFLTASIHSQYENFGVTQAAQADWQRRAACAFSAAIVIGDRMDIVSVGDCGLRINLDATHQSLKPLDDIAALLRLEAWRHFERLGMMADECSRLALQVARLGTGTRIEIIEHTTAAVLSQIEKTVLRECCRRYPEAPPGEIQELLRGGFLYAQGGFQNVDDRYLAYGALDGFQIPEKFIDSRSYALQDIAVVELFSDGYFSCGSGFGVDAWEKAFREVEARDPHKIGDYMSTKGSTADSYTDDRTYVGVRLR